MDFARFIASGAVAIAEGAVLERVRRNGNIPLDPHLLSGGLIYDPSGREALENVHRGYIQSARNAGLPILVSTDTWRCSQYRIEASRFRARPVNQDNARFLIGLKSAFGDGPPIFVGGLTGPSGDAYKPDDSLRRRAAAAFHQPQLDALASTGVDFLHLATAPNVDEALGVADAMAATGLPYLISFVIRRSGHVLDGTPLGAAMARIDTEAPRPPVGFSVNCVHARVLETALEAAGASHPNALRRLMTFQANAADMEVEELDGSDVLHTEPAEAFAGRLMQLRARFGLRVLGGCCGTDASHIEALASRLRCEAIGS